MTFRQAARALLVVMTMAQSPAQAARPWAEAYEAGLGLFKQRDYTGARAAMLDALEDLEGKPAVDSRLPATLHVLGASEQALGRYEEARKRLEAALSRWPDTLDGVRQTAATLECLGNLMADTGHWEAAEQHFRSALAMREKVSGASSRETASALNRVAGTFLSQGRLVGARPLLERALAIQRQLPVDGDPEFLTTQIMLAHTLRSLGRLEEARQCAADAEAAGRHSQTYPEILFILGDVYRMQGNFARAVPLLRRSIELAALRTSDRELPAAVTSLAYIDLGEGRVLSARKGFQQAITIIERLWGAGIPEVASAQVGLAAAMLESRRVEEATSLLDAAQPYIEQTFRDDHVFRAVGLMLRAVLAAARGNRDRSAWAAMEREGEGMAHGGLWALCARLMRPYRTDLARVAEKRSRIAAREVAGGRIGLELR